MAPRGQVRDSAEKYGVSSAFARAWTAAIVALTVAPYLWAYWTTPKGYTYAWTLPPYVQDSYAYLAWSQQAARGALLFSFKYTALAHEPFVFQPFFLICGWLGRLSGVGLGLIHLAMKSLGVVLFFQAFYALVAHFRLTRRLASLASVLVGTSSGLGALLLPFMGGIPDKTSPVDLWLVDSNTLWSLLWNPLFPYSLTTILMAVLWFDRGAQGEGGQRPLWLSGAALGLLALIHPYTVPLLYALLGMIAAIRLRWKAPHALFPVLVASAPALVYVAGLSLFNPLVRLHSLTGEMQSPSITLYVLGFGLPLLTAIFGTFVFWKAMSERLWPLLLWVYLAIFLAYCPLWFSDKLIFGLHAPICILAAVSFDLAALRKLDGRPPWTRAAAVAALLLAAAPTQLRLFIRTPGELARNAEARYRIPDDLLAGMEYLRKNSAPSDLVFAPIGVSNQLPAYSGNTVVWGHWAQSVDLKLREKWYMDVFGADSLLSEQERGRAFWSFGIRYVFASGDLKDWLDAHHPAWISARATKVFENPAVTIFRRNGA